MVDFYNIYKHQGAMYQAMIEAEDFQQNLVRALRAKIPNNSRNLLDLGSGTGRLPRILQHDFDSIIGLDLHRNMLLQQQADPNLNILQADMRILPVSDSSFDVVSAGWAIGHLCGWYPQDWHEHISKVLDEMQRTCKPGGLLMIMETMSTGALQPAPPTPWLAELYDCFVANWGFTQKVISTDYLFPSVMQAKALTGFFFGEQMLEKIDQYQWQQLPEWTGIWWKRNTA
ncbi:MAG: class I SAM-dependent methyltransferase [Anaerolineaceae bacterium]|nr:class I SAM-dependent methyltransferase [Anaerolineaceae bacterium]